MAVLIAGAFTVVAPAGAAGTGPTMDHCYWWPNETTVHWDRSYLLDYYKSSSVDKVVFHWRNAFGPGDLVTIDGDTARATTPIGSTEADAELFLANGRTVFSNTVACVPKP